MFEDSLIESGNKLKTKRGGTTTIAFLFQIGLIGVLVLRSRFPELLPIAHLPHACQSVYDVSSQFAIGIPGVSLPLALRLPRPTIPCRINLAHSPSRNRE